MPSDFYGHATPIVRPGAHAQPAASEPHAHTPRSITADAVKHLFREHALRWSRQREILYIELYGSTSHPTAEELHLAVHRLDDQLSLATVYNALDAFCEAGLCRRMSAPGTAVARYDANTQQHVHVATEDGRVADVPDDLNREVLDHLPPELIRRIEARTGIAIHRINLQFVGTALPQAVGTPAHAE